MQFLRSFRGLGLYYCRWAILCAVECFMGFGGLGAWGFGGGIRGEGVC